MCIRLNKIGDGCSTDGSTSFRIYYHRVSWKIFLGEICIVVFYLVGMLQVIGRYSP
uniref:Uncharacterized protein n=1 Tax=Rhizophora mucronata TaxID=61149 RepID=A0A2P2J0I0_RHIMU